jgi:Ca-activated chloride channel family protein
MTYPIVLSTLVAAICVVSPQAQVPEQAIRIVHPAAGSTMAGPSPLEADVVPSSANVRRMTFFVDGQRVCEAVSAPFRCDWDAGSRSAPRTVRVVADLASGHRLVGTRRTRARGVTFTASTDAVLVPTRVIDTRGQFVQGLQPAQFQVFEDGRPQQIASVISEGTPASVMLALDMSASMQAKVGDLRRAAAMFLDAVRPDDAVSIAGFNEGLFVLTRPGANTSARHDALARLRPWGDTALYDSLIRAAGILRNQPSPRAVVAFTDGEDVASRASVQTVRSVLQGADVVLYLVVGAEPPVPGSPLARLARIADETGGAAWFNPRLDALGSRFAAIVDDLSNGYVLTYLPDRPVGDGAWRELQVQVAGVDRETAIRARQGYLAVER